MPPKQTECAFGTCKFPCIKSDYRRNFLTAYPDGYPTRGSGTYTCRECGHGCSTSEMQVDHMNPAVSREAAKIGVHLARCSQGCLYR